MQSTRITRPTALQHLWLSCGLMWHHDVDAFVGLKSKTPKETGDLTALLAELKERTDLIKILAILFRLQNYRGTHRSLLVKRMVKDEEN